MIYEFLPWKLDVDAEATKLFYETNDFSKDKSVNEEFIESLTEEQKNFFNSLGVNLFKIEVDKTIYDIPEDEDTPASKIKRIVINFLIKGKILALPQYQKEIYSDEEVFGKELFDHVQGQKDGVPKKPDPTAALTIARSLGVLPGESAYIGDSEVDLATGHAAKMQTILVSWGFRGRKVLLEDGAECVVDSADEIRKIVKKQEEKSNGRVQ